MSEKSKKNWATFLKIVSYVVTAILGAITGESVNLTNLI